VKKLDWKPLISFSCILALLFFIVALFNITAAQWLVGFIITAMLTLSGLSPEHYNFLKDSWFNNIPSETHQFIIYFFIGIVVYLALLFLVLVTYYCIKNYKNLPQVIKNISI